jgi:hypothetical protein
MLRLPEDEKGPAAASGVCGSNPRIWHDTLENRDGPACIHGRADTPRSEATLF